jgi:hypothetical protein
MMMTLLDDEYRGAYGMEMRESGLGKYGLRDHDAGESPILRRVARHSHNTIVRFP